MAAEQKLQIGLGEQVVDDESLLTALKTWESKKIAVQKASESLKQAREVLDGKVALFEMKPGEVLRCGPYRITCQVTDEAEVQFTRRAAERTSYRRVKEE